MNAKLITAISSLALCAACQSQHARVVNRVNRKPNRMVT